MQKTVNFALKRETQGTLVYQEVDSSGEPTREVVGSQYIQKSALGGKKPSTMSATYTFSDN